MNKKTKNFFKVDTIKKLRKLQRYILEEPKRIHMNDWGAHVDPKNKVAKRRIKEAFCITKSYDRTDLLSTLLAVNPPCGTMACAAGSLCVIGGLIKPAKKRVNGGGYYQFPSNTPEIAAKYLGIDEEIADRLFYFKEWNDDDNGWPKKFENSLNNTKPGTKAYAKVVVARIEHFIRTGE